MSYTDDTITQTNGAGQSGSEYGQKSKFRESAQSMFESGKDQFDSALDATKMGMDQAQQFLTRNMHERPMTSTAVAMALGLVVGMLIASRR